MQNGPRVTTKLNRVKVVKTNNCSASFPNKTFKQKSGVTVLLTEALEEFVKGEVKSEINDTLSTCSSIYPDLFNGGSQETLEAGDQRTQSGDQCIQESEKMLETATESEKEYYEGFMARPKIPRTPQV